MARCAIYPATWRDETKECMRRTLWVVINFSLPKLVFLYFFEHYRLSLSKFNPVPSAYIYIKRYLPMIVTSDKKIGSFQLKSKEDTA